MSNFTLELEAMAGTSIEDVISEAKDLAGRLGIAYVKFDFNGVSMSIRQRSDVKEAADKFREALRKSHKFVVA
ncbi:hypothetical protein CA267_001840 [Alteromonas pelagimontana]|uniref:Uncharacterized protein n=1 Tax=Alteromonas pelagimontana TaxID=1858656 RepID=A0A6M4MAN1_9ALTE|nr:hypothetical protein [Alteromonas pelagimontana]QJR79625.1 hypothetical protein CA267_001840 [Alteromonas pelagimontana]